MSAGLDASTVTPGMTAPDTSCTSPTMLARSWARAGTASDAAQINAPQHPPKSALDNKEVFDRDACESSEGRVIACSFGAVRKPSRRSGAGILGSQFAGLLRKVAREYSEFVRSTRSFLIIGDSLLGVVER